MPSLSTAGPVRPQAQLIRLGNDRYSPRHRDTGLSPFLLECAKQGKTGRFEVLSIDRVQPPAEVAERLGVSARAKSVLRRENVFYADDDPVNRVTTYIPWTVAQGAGLLQATRCRTSSASMASSKNSTTR